MILVDEEKQSQNDLVSRRSNLASQITRGTTALGDPGNGPNKKYPKISITYQQDQEENIKDEYIGETN